MIAIFTIPKAFAGHTGIIQRNALSSWTRLGCEVFVCGDDDGVGQAAADAGVTWIPDIERNEFGTPILRSAFASVAARADAGVLCYVNADIILFPDLRDAIDRVRWRHTVAAGQRWDLDVRAAIDFSRPEVEREIREDVRVRGRLHGAYGSDYFVFPRDPALLDIPSFGVGRPGWDCWFIYHVRKLGYRMIDATRQVTVVHQNHDYSHLSPKSGATTDGKKWTGPEAASNERLIGGKSHYFTLQDATHVFESGRVRFAWDYLHLRSRWHRFPVLNPWSRRTFDIVDRLMPQHARKVLRRMLG